MAWGTLYVVATPLGHLGDLSSRAAEILRAVPAVAAEDTRRTRVLLSHLGASPKMFSYHAHSAPERAKRLLDLMRNGADLALVTDAGTPGVSDPGRDLVAQVYEGGGRVVPVPGPSAVTAALSVSGLSADRYLFLGFLPRKGRSRQALLKTAQESPWTVVLFEAPGRLLDLLDDLVPLVPPGRRVVITRELTKLHEEIRSGTPAEQRTYWSGREPKGEITIVLEGCGGTPGAPGTSDPGAARELAAALLGDGLTARDAARRVAEATGLSRNEAYRLVTELT